jgi:hypothetical protein
MRSFACRSSSLSSRSTRTAHRINLLISLVALAASAVSRRGFLHTVDLADHRVEIVGMLVGSVLAERRAF